MHSERAGTVRMEAGTGEATVGGAGRVRRERLVAAVVSEVAEVGYEAATVSAICRRAGDSEAAFAAEFSTKEECFLAACQRFADTLLAEAREGLAAASDWQEGVRAGLGTVLTYLAEHPTEARACLVEGLAAGPEALAIRDATFQAFARLVDIFHERLHDDAGPRALVTAASVGGVYGIVMRRIRDGQTSTLPELVASLSYFLVAPVVGGPQARLEFAESP